MKKEFNEISARIRELREVCGYSQKQLAEELGIEESVYAGYEQEGENIPISVSLRLLPASVRSLTPITL